MPLFWVELSISTFVGYFSPPAFLAQLRSPMLNLRYPRSRTVVIAALLSACAANLFAQEARLSNLSTRAQVGIDANQIFAGIVIGPGDSRTVLIRAIGPTLGPAPFGLGTLTLTNPALVLFNSAKTPLPSRSSPRSSASPCGFF